MLKTIFIGSKNRFDEILVKELSKFTEVTGVVWTKSNEWKATLGGRVNFFKKRVKRYGTLKVMNEILFYFYYHKFLKFDDLGDLKNNIINPYFEKNGDVEWKGDSIFTSNVNNPDVLDFISSKSPDLVFAMCINNFFGKKIRSIPTKGVLLWHEGITPEYKGLYSPFWTMHNGDFDNLGYTVLRMNDELDGGEIFVQGKAQDIDPRKHQFGYIGHKAIYDSLPAVKEFIRSLEKGEEKPIKRESAESGVYTYPGIFDYLRQKKQIRNYLV